MDRKYRSLIHQTCTDGTYTLVPLRSTDRYKIMQWRNEQIYHLRQERPLTKEDQDQYFDNVIADEFEKEKPAQILFSFLNKDEVIGYGGLVHINWKDRNAEISFVMDTKLEEKSFELLWIAYLDLIEQVAFKELELHKIFTYAFDLRPRLYIVLAKTGFKEEAILKEHCFFDGKYIDVLIHSKINQ